ncbi:MAG TPA: hypothetical protein VKV04_12075 [Verrucomicrobiae bacterium]|nr:hypothetical protein [Verrucomicrobiae bacterium]
MLVDIEYFQFHIGIRGNMHARVRRVGGMDKERKQQQAKHRSRAQKSCKLALRTSGHSEQDNNKHHDVCQAIIGPVTGIIAAQAKAAFSEEGEWEI